MSVSVCSGDVLSWSEDSNLCKKGLRDRNSPTCTLSQNGYGAEWITLRLFTRFYNNGKHDVCRVFVWL